MILAAALRRLGVDVAGASRSSSTRPVLGHGEPVGAIVAVSL